MCGCCVSKPEYRSCITQHSLPDRGLSRCPQHDDAFSDFWQCRFRTKPRCLDVRAPCMAYQSSFRATAIALQQGEPSTCSALLERLRDVQGLEVDDVGSHPPGAPACRCSYTVSHPSHVCLC